MRERPARRIERRRDLRDDRLHFREREPLPLLPAQIHDPAEREPFEKLRGDERPAVVVPGLVDARDVGVGEPLRLVQLFDEGAPLVGHLEKTRREDLQRDVAVVRDFHRAEHPAQRARPGVVLDLVAPGDDLARLAGRAFDRVARPLDAGAESSRRPGLQARVEPLAAGDAPAFAILDVPPAAIAQHGDSPPSSGKRYQSVRGSSTPGPVGSLVSLTDAPRRKTSK